MLSGDFDYPQIGLGFSQPVGLTDGTEAINNASSHSKHKNNAT